MDTIFMNSENSRVSEYHVLVLLLKTLVKIQVINMVKSFLIVLKKSARDALKTARKRAIQKRAEATGGLVGNKIADKITTISKKPAIEPHSNAARNEIPKERYISPQERQKIIDELRFI